MLCYAMLCYAMLCYAMLCYAMLCYAMLCYAMLYCIICWKMSRVQRQHGLPENPRHEKISLDAIEVPADSRNCLESPVAQKSGPLYLSPSLSQSSPKSEATGIQVTLIGTLVLPSLPDLATRVGFRLLKPCGS